MAKSFTLHDLPSDERPRERLVKFGEQALSAQELLQLILGRGIAGESVVVTAQKLLTQFGSLQKLSEASIEELSSIKGIGPAKAAQIKAVFEVARRVNLSTQSNQLYDRRKKRYVMEAGDLYKLIKVKLKNYSKEHFFIASLDNRNKLLSIDAISTGTLTASLVHPRETFETAISKKAERIILLHNHPSESPEPSKNDLVITRRLVEAGKILGIKVIDHIIITKKEYFSLKDKGLI